MKKTDMTITMPLTTYEQVMNKLNVLQNTVNELSCTIKEGVDGYYFDTSEALVIIKRIKFMKPDSVGVEKI